MSTLFDIEPTALVVPDNTVTRDQLPNLADYDLIVGNLSGGKDSWLMQSVLMDAARAAGVADRVWTFHATLGPLEWPGVEYGGQYYPSVSELAAQQSAASGVPAERHIEATKLTLDDDPEPYDLLTYIAAYGCFPRLGTRYCTKAFKEQVEDASFTPIINGLKVKLGLATKPNAVKLTRRVRRLKSLGLRSDESRDRAARSGQCCAGCISRAAEKCLDTTASARCSCRIVARWGGPVRDLACATSAAGVLTAPVVRWVHHCMRIARGR
ncbi:hypothetical protein OHB41_08825 [Streptomyces sp. NBC_01571]|uniref:hypothetical protein n=1 Tax=Streptomyces sp. NBC_01571 TaxID=2975883 RepID=UPI0022545467|nr:hypothetical protein [Streptomyces sp. NBC_01571]MCX4573282.1 hypothetical protein [Streptomyces sp. NBC_01571]